MRILLTALCLLPPAVAAQPLPPAPPPVCMPASQAQALVSWLAQASPLQAQIIEASLAQAREAEVVKRAKAEQKAEDDAKVKP